jgi:flagellar FliJ protein
MKKFKFKLDSVLKLKSFKEEKIKMELGAIVAQIHNCKDVMAKIKDDVNSAYKDQETMLKKGATGQEVQFFAHFVKGKKEHMIFQQNILKELNESYNIKITELKVIKGEVKIVENLKEKKKTEFNKDEEKKFQASIDELTLARLSLEKDL